MQWKTVFEWRGKKTERMNEKKGKYLINMQSTKNCGICLWIDVKKSGEISFSA
jgi:hypothetical protein